jgi:hypothetical protein
VKVVSAVVDLAAMTHPQDKDEELIIMNLVDDAVVAGSDPPLAGTTNETGCGRWTRILSEEFEDGLDASSNVGIKLAELASCRR